MNGHEALLLARFERRQWLDPWDGGIRLNKFSHTLFELRNQSGERLPFARGFAFQPCQIRNAGPDTSAGSRHHVDNATECGNDRRGNRFGTNGIWSLFRWHEILKRLLDGVPAVLVVTIARARPR